MSSMFKKKGGLAFKPKIPSARARPAVPAVADIEIQKDVVAEPEPVLIAAVESPSVDTRESSSHVASTSESENIASPESSSIAKDSPIVTSEPPSTQDVSRLKPTAEHTQLPGVQQQQQQQSSTQEASEILSRNQAAEAATATNAQHFEPPRVYKPREPPPIVADHNIAPELRDPPRPPQDIQDTAPETATNGYPSQPSQPVTQETTPAATPAPATTGPRTRSRRKAPENANGDADADADARPKKRQRKASEAEDGTAAPKPRQRKASSTQDGTTTPRTRARRARSVTPDDAENQMVDLQNLKMTDLTKDLHIGKKFSRHDELRERERQSRLKSKLKKVLGDSSRDGSEAPETPPGGDLSVKSKSATPTAMSTPAPAPASGPQFRIVDGQIIIDQSSLVMDRHARAAATRGDMETVEENDFTRLITSSSFMNTSKLKGPNIWTDEETELFYRGLRMFGTEFEMISKMFPNKQRRHVKLKYNREERHCPHLINAALIGEKTVRIDIDEYKAFTGIEFESVESIEAEQRKIQEDFEAEQKRIADEQAEIMRKKREELFADEDGGEDGKRRKKGKKKGKQAVQYGLNGEPIPAGES